MNQDRFDDLTRTLASPTSRRTVLKTLAGSAAGGLLALLGGGEAAADDTCKPVGKKCRKAAQCCSGVCTDGTCVTPPTPGNQFECACGAGTTQTLCSTASCNDMRTVCEALCADHGGLGGTFSCAAGACVLT